MEPAMTEIKVGTVLVNGEQEDTVTEIVVRHNPNGDWIVYFKFEKDKAEVPFWELLQFLQRGARIKE